MSKNANLHTAKKEKNDEFYTQLSDIEKELKHYKNHLANKIIYCNCDDCYESNFFKYFALNFNTLKLKKLITTCYAESKVCGKEQDLWGDETSKEDNSKKAYKIEITNVDDFNGDGKIDLKDIVESLISNKENTLTILNGNGSFESDECIELLKECDIVITNPPFSLFREYVSTLIKYNKKFLIVGNSNAITDKDIFPYIKNEQMWLGNNNVKEFKKPDGTTQKFGNICWYTNLIHNKRNEELILFKSYNKIDYPTYDNFRNVINVNKLTDIPADYFGYMGVPLTIIDKINPNQFSIIWQLSGNTRVCCPKEILDSFNYIPSTIDRGGCGVVNGNRKYTRVVIRRKDI